MVPMQIQMLLYVKKKKPLLMIKVMTEFKQTCVLIPKRMHYAS